MAKPQTDGLTRKLRQTVLQQVGVHLDAHLRAHHFPHISKIHKRRRLTDRNSRKPKPHQIVQKLDIYSASVPAAARSNLDQLIADGWILLVESAEGLCTQVEIHKRDGQFAVVRVTTGALADSLASAIARVQSRSTGRISSRPELRIFAVPAMHVFGVWAHQPKRPQKDFFIPTMSNFLGLRQTRKYSFATVQRQLQRGAIAMILRWYEQQQEPRPIQPS